MSLKHRFYLAVGMYFEVYDDGTVILYDRGRVVARKKLEHLSRSAILAAFEPQLRRRGVEPAGILGVISEKLDDVLESIDEIKAALKKKK